jgi:hypothetical protein
VGNGVNYHFNPGEAQLRLAVASAIVTLLIFATEGLARVGVYVATAVVELWLKVYAAVNDQRARQQEVAQRQLDLTLTGREPPDPGEAGGGRGVPDLVGSTWNTWGRQGGAT